MYLEVKCVKMMDTTSTLSMLKKIGWFVFIWAASVLALAGIAYALKLIMRLVGLA